MKHPNLFKMKHQSLDHKTPTEVYVGIVENRNPWICGRVLRTSQRPLGRVDKPWITLTRYPPLDHTRWLLAPIPTGTTTLILINVKEADDVFLNPPSYRQQVE
jgi:hypothetical protein